MNTNRFRVWGEAVRERERRWEMGARVQSLILSKIGFVVDEDEDVYFSIEQWQERGADDTILTET